MKKIILIMILLFLVSCNFMSGSRETIKTPDIYVGTEGVELYFFENKPPEKMYEGKIMDIGFLLWNKGAYDVNRGMYSIAVNEQYIEILDPKTGDVNIEGKSVYNPEGGREKIEVRARTRKINPQLTKFSTTISTSVCYDYQTKGSAIVCIDTKPEETDSTKICTPSTISMTSQGAPVAISSVEPRMTPHEIPGKIMPVFIIKMKNIGQGQIVKTGHAYDVCTGESIGRENYDVISVSAKLSDDILTCTPSQIKLGTARDAVMCVLEKGIDNTKGTYTGPVTVELNYGYTKTRPFTIAIEKPIV